MNLFVLDHNPDLAVQYHNDKHIVKMVIETAQLLSTAHHVLDGTPHINCYRSTHKNHPSAIWVRESNNNYNWAYYFFTKQCDEYTHRYGKVHLTDTKMRDQLVHLPRNIPVGPKTTPPACMPDEYKVDDIVESYRNYYRGDKAHFAKWTNREVPEWFVQ